jgi:protein involved in polysaccharide export with SLBB domain
MLVTAVGAFAQEKNAAPPSVSCLGPEGESYLRELLTRIHDLEEQIDAAKQALLTERDKEARSLQDKESELSERAAAQSERDRARAADLEASKKEIERLRAASERAADAEKQLAALRAKEGELMDRAAALSEQERLRATELEALKQEVEKLRSSAAAGADATKEASAAKMAVEEANEARRRAEEEAAAAKRAAAREAHAREETEKHVAELERQRAASRAIAEGALARSERRPLEATESVQASTASRPPARPNTENTGSADRSERDLASAQLAALSGKASTGSQPSRTATGSEGTPDERLRPGDRLTLRVAKLDELNRTVQIARDGSIDLPLIGSIRAAGRTEQELVADLSERLSAYVREPQVELSREHVERPPAPDAGKTQPPVEEHAPVPEAHDEPAPAPSGTYSVEGSVAQPGTYPLKGRTTLTGAINEAGGASFAGRLDEVEIEHTSGGSEARHEVVNVEKIIDTRGTDVTIRPGDIVRVPGSRLWALPWGIVRIVTFPFWYPFS